MKKYFLVIISLLVVSFLLIGCSFSFGMPSAPTQQGESVSEDNGGGTTEEENGSEITEENTENENTDETSSDTGESTGETTQTHVLTVADIKDGIVLPKEARNALMAMIDVFIKDDAPLLSVGFMTTNHALWHIHVQAKVDYTISGETFDKAKAMLTSMGYPEELISVNYGDYGGGLAMGLTDKGFSIDVGYDKDGGSIVIGMGLKASEIKPQLGLDVSKVKGDYWQCVGDVFKTAKVDASQLADDNMLAIGYQDGGVTVDFSILKQLSDTEVKTRLMALKAKYGGDYTEMAGISALEGAKCKKATISAGNMSASSGKGAFNVHIEWRQ